MSDRVGAPSSVFFPSLLRRRFAREGCQMVSYPPPRCSFRRLRFHMEGAEIPRAHFGGILSVTVCLHVNGIRWCTGLALPCSLHRLRLHLEGVKNRPAPLPVCVPPSLPFFPSLDGTWRPTFEWTAIALLRHCCMGGSRLCVWIFVCYACVAYRYLLKVSSY